MYIVWLWLIIYSLHFVLEGFGNIWNGYGVECLGFDYWLGWSMHPTPNKITEKGHEIWCDWKGHYSVAYRLSVLPVLITILQHFFAGGWLSADFLVSFLCHIIFGVLCYIRVAAADMYSNMFGITKMACNLLQWLLGVHGVAERCDMSGWFRLEWREKVEF